MQIVVSYEKETNSLLEFIEAVKAMPIGAVWFVDRMEHLPQLQGEKKADDKIYIKVGLFFNMTVDIKSYWNLYHNNEDKRTQFLMKKINETLSYRGLGNAF